MATRAEEIIVEIFRQREDLVGEGRRPSRVIMSRAHYDQIQEYRAQLGDLPTGADYLAKYHVFDLEICVEDVQTPRVEAD